MLKVFSRILANVGSMFRSAAAIIARDEIPIRESVSPESKEKGYELRDAHVLALVVLALSMGGGVILLQGVLWMTFEHLKAGKAGDSHSHEVFPDAFLKASRPEQELATYRLKMEKNSSSYGWVDRKNGLVRVPVERAMEMLSHGN
jgi:hypothetical protein